MLKFFLRELMSVLGELMPSFEFAFGQFQCSAISCSPQVVAGGWQIKAFRVSRHFVVIFITFSCCYMFPEPPCTAWSRRLLNTLFALAIVVVVLPQWQRRRELVVAA